ncbi:MAG: LLM class flavin-dependent oxidoreductase [Rhodospirillaceae bacterium]|nr:LLM class flavin-dependent oxidoreductase [Rhodospirillaceae bacterium]MBT5191730.1 LLM class flavin-dependent oxidoreductase [Rhodospirillaceae bacterium]MBT5899055.1 LLM class flavin-dependent oxidoreductase [Rhodospirillaceae bacterium]MBT6428276.1 LLM class flavin-dependent oxidoreductase [Rhodospirillaceae bacterium]MBT7761102.1 LLM class flavin-dependent oxidoreductase [Rhodospirillaceae bacterium]
MKARFGIIDVPRSIESAIENAKLAESVGFDWVGIADSQSLFRELFVTLGVVGQATERVMIGPSVTNPLTRHPAVMASAAASVQEITGGRAMLGIGTGDSAIYNLNERPGGLKGLREYILTLRALLNGATTEFAGREIHTKWVAAQADNPVPIYISAEGPKTLELAGEVADGVICGMGVSADVVQLTLDHIARGAERAGRSIDDIDIWAMTRVNVGTDRAALIDEIRMELASTAHHAFRFTQEGKLVPPEFAEAIRQVQSGYRPANHEDLGESPNAGLMNDPALLAYMTERFAVIGTADECVTRIQSIRAAGIHQFLFTGFVEARTALIETLGKSVFPRCRN